MDAPRPTHPGSGASPPAEDSPVLVLQHLEQERGRLFTEAEYQEMRRAIIDELALGARLRPSTFVTFGAVAAVFFFLLVGGLATSDGRTLGDYALPLFSALALACVTGFFLSLVRAMRRDRERSLDERLSELGELRPLSLVTREEHEHIEAHILHARQHARPTRTRHLSDST